MDNLSELTSIGLKIILLLMVCFCTIHSLFMMYHWYTFGQHKQTATIAAVVYLFGLFTFFVIMTSAVFTYTYV